MADMKIAGNRVLLRAVEEQDQGMLQSLIHDPDIVKVTKGYSGYISCALQEEGSGLFSDNAGGLRSVIADRKAPDRGMGIIMLSYADLSDKAAEIRIKLIKSARGRGYAQDAVNTLVRYAFCELQLDCICSRILENNTASQRLFEACGFQREGTCRSRADREGRCREVCFYVIRRSGKPFAPSSESVKKITEIKH